MKFIKENFHFSGGYLNYYIDYKHHPKFIARFKYNAGDRHKFITKLIKNFTVEEYLMRLDNDEAPFQIVS